MTSLSTTPVLVALVQAASIFPISLLSLPAGALEDGPVTAGAHPLPALAAAIITAKNEILVNAGNDAEVLLVEVLAA